MREFDPPISVEIIVTHDSQLRAVYAVLANPNIADAILVGNEMNRQRPQQGGPPDGDESLNTYNEYAEKPDTAAVGTAEGTEEIDAHGHPWSAELNASTKGKTKDGLWRLKVGASRPAPQPGFPRDATTGTSASGAGSEASGSAATEVASSQDATTGDDDEFAAFRAAAAASDAKDAAAAANVPARKFTDADLGTLCNQAAVKLDGSAPIKAIIATFCPEGTVVHSRNIPEDQRAAFAAAVEAKAGIEFAG